jgi:hypothetical protein
MTGAVYGKSLFIFKIPGAAREPAQQVILDVSTGLTSI